MADELAVECDFNIVSVRLIDLWHKLRVLTIHHLFAWHSVRYKNSFLMQLPNDLDLYPGNEVCSSLARIDQPKPSICADVPTE